MVVFGACLNLFDASDYNFLCGKLDYVGSGLVSPVHLEAGDRCPFCSTAKGRVALFFGLS